MNIGILGCDDVAEPYRGIAGGYREMFEALLKPRMPDASFRWYGVCEGDLPASPDACDGWLCSGSRFSVYDAHDWIGRLKRFVRDVHEARMPFAGICFGHQVLAQALGGKVERAPQGWGIGVLEMTIGKPEPWMQPPLDRCKLQYMHGDQVRELPPGGVVLAQAPHCPVAMFRVDRMLGIEGHPEFPAAYAQALLRARRERIGPEAVDAALASLAQPTDHGVVAAWIGAFLGASRVPAAR